MLTKETKKQLKRFGALLTAAALIVSSIPGQAKQSSKSVPTGIQLKAPYRVANKKFTTTLTLKKGKKFKIRASILPSSAKKKKLVYKSKKSKIASVSKKGVIRAKKVGKTNITVSPKGYSKIKATIKVTVVKKLKKVKKIKLSQQSLTLTLGGKGNTKALKAKIISPKKATNKKINWMSSNSKVASVNKKGVVTAKSVGSANIIAVAADGQGAKSTCKVTVRKNSGVVTPFSSGKPPVSSARPSDGASSQPSPGASGQPLPGVSGQPSPGASGQPSEMPSQQPGESITITVPDSRTGVKQGESMQFSAIGTTSQKEVSVTWSVTPASSAAISSAGLLTVSANAAATSLTVTAVNTNDTTKKASVTLRVVENQSSVGENSIRINPESEGHPQGLTYRDPGAYSTVIDPMRGAVTRFDSSVGYKNDMLAWLEVDSAYAGKTVNISAYIKYDKLPETQGAGLVINERWEYSNPASKWNADPDTWYHVTGEFTLPQQASKYNGTNNMLYISRYINLKDDEYMVYYIDGLEISYEKSKVESVELKADKDATEIYQNETLQFSAAVNGTNAPSQEVTYSIEPEVKGASISDKGLLTVGDVQAGTKINVKAASVEDKTKSATKTITVLEKTEDSPIVIKATLDNMWSVIDESFYRNMSYDETKGGIKFADPPRATTLASGEAKSYVGFLANKDESPIDVSDYDYLEVDFETYKSASLADTIYGAEIQVFQSSDKSFPGKIVRQGYLVSSKTERMTWRIPLKKLVAAGVDLTDIKALAVAKDSSDQNKYMYIYSFTFVKNSKEEYLSKDEPVAVSIKQSATATDPGNCSIGINESLALSANIANKNDVLLQGNKIKWTSEDDSKAMVSADGKVTGKAAGTVNITAAVEGYEKVTASYPVTVVDETTADGTDIQIGDYSPRVGFYALDEVKEGLDIKGVLVNAFGEKAGETSEQTITVTEDRYTTGAVIEGGKLKVTSVGTASTGIAYIELTLPATDSYPEKTKQIGIVNGYRIPLTKETVSCLHPDKMESSEVTVKNGIASIATFKDGSDNGFRIKASLPEGKTISSYNNIACQLEGSEAKAAVYYGDAYTSGEKFITESKVRGLKPSSLGTPNMSITISTTKLTDVQESNQLDLTYLFRDRNQSKLSVTSLFVYSKPGA